MRQFHIYLYLGPSGFPGSNQFFCCFLGLELALLLKAHWLPLLCTVWEVCAWVVISLLPPLIPRLVGRDILEYFSQQQSSSSVLALCSAPTPRHMGLSSPPNSAITVLAPKFHFWFHIFSCLFSVTSGSPLLCFLCSWHLRISVSCFSASLYISNVFVIF